MSFRELRNFKEIMCTLGYPRLISIENFKVPHFELVADILIWMCGCVDKNMQIMDEIRTEADRVVFLKSVAEQLLVKARIKLNLKNLYASNGFAVRELLKVATMLHDAYRSANIDEADDTEGMPADIGPGHKFSDMKLTRSLSTDITKYGARLHELLATHAESKESASRALGKNFDIDFLSKQLHLTVESVSEQSEQMERMLANLSQDEQKLQQQIDKKKTELDRHQKRLQSLQTVRPAFMDEYERYEMELSSQYALYVQCFRNLSYLESELDAINAQEQDKIAENDRQLKMMQRRLREEELRILRGQAKVDEKALDDALLSDSQQPNARAIKRPGAASMRRDGRGASGGNQMEEDVYGSMKPMDDGEEDEDEDEDESEGSGEDGSDGQVEFTHDDGEDDDNSLDDDLDDEDGVDDDDDDEF